MGKKKVAILGSENEEQIRAKRDVQREQKKMREGKGAKAEEVAVESTTEIAPTPVENTESEVKTVKKGVHHRSKSYLTSKAKVDITKLYTLEDGIKLLREISYSTTNDTVELHINLKDAFTKEVVLPYSTGKKKVIAVATEETIAAIESGKINFDVLLASPSQMAKLVKLAKVLGPRGLMPNPKNGTVIEDPEAKAKDLAGKNVLNLKTEKDAPLLHLTVGKLAMQDAELAENITSILTALPATKVTKVVLKSTMSPAIKLVIA
jgi:large subunit ribosomal protein L1